MRHRQTFTAAGTLALALVLGACSPGDGEEQMTKAPTKEDRYIESVRENVPQAQGVADDQLLSYGEATCDALEAGITIEELALVIGHEVTDTEVAGVLGRIGGTAAATLCPGALMTGG